MRWLRYTPCFALAVLTGSMAAAQTPGVDTAGAASQISVPGAQPPTPAKALQLLAVDVGGERPLVELQVVTQGDTAGRTVRVNYVLEVSGTSSTRHAGATNIQPGDSATVSRVRISRAPGWCAVLSVEQDDGFSYRLEQGNCGSTAVL